MAKKEVTKEGGEEVQRIFKGETQFNCDLFKLEAAMVTKNHGWSIETPIWQKDPHVHYFYSVDSAGKKQYFCSPIAGHQHACEVFEEGGKLKIKVGPAVQVKGGVAYPNVVLPAHKTRKESHGGPNEILDAHTHESTYLESHKVTPRKFVQAAQDAIAKRISEDARLES